jgi:hypothetical protein
MPIAKLMYAVSQLYDAARCPGCRVSRQATLANASFFRVLRALKKL